MSTTEPTPEDVHSAQVAAANADGGGADYPATSGDLAPEGQAQQAQAGGLDAAMATVGGVEAYLADATDDQDRARRADAIEQAEGQREGGPRKGVTQAVTDARQ
jgi:hypothetical protein